MASASSSTPADAVNYVAVIKFPSFYRFRQTAGDARADACLKAYARDLALSSRDIWIGRTGDETIEFGLIATSEDEAVGKVRHVLEIVHQQDETEALDHFKDPRAGLKAIDQLPPPQSAFDAAMEALEAEKDAKNQISVAKSSVKTSARKSSKEIVRRLRDALGSGEVSLAYQPKLDVREKAFRTAEALFRWDSSEGRNMNIGELIVAAERHGAIRDLTIWSLKRAVSDQLSLIDNGIDLKTFVNVSGRLISDSEFTLQAIEIIKATSGKIGIEITETSVIEHAGHALANLELFSAAGAEIAIDDYGTGLSSLRYLKRIPAQELKIDREFIKDLTSSHRDPMIVRSTIDLAHALGLKVTAEGVDDPTKMALLKVMGCDQLQGFFIAKPMPLTALVEFMQDIEKQNSLINSEVSLLPGQAKSNGGG